MICICMYVMFVAGDIGCDERWLPFTVIITNNFHCIISRKSAKYIQRKHSVYI